MALAGLSEDLIYQIHAKPKAKAKALVSSAASAVSDSERVEQHLIARLASVAPLIHAAKVAQKALKELGEGFRRSTRSISADAVFLRQVEDKARNELLRYKARNRRQRERRIR